MEQTGSVVVNARLFGDIIRKLPDGIVTVKAEDTNINVRCGKSNFFYSTGSNYPFAIRDLGPGYDPGIAHKIGSIEAFCFVTS